MTREPCRRGSLRHPPSAFLLRECGPLIAAAVCATSAALFLPQQEIWIDETTQITGLAMGPAGVVGWLMAPTSADTPIPGDRMPPLSYWLGQAWAALFGPTETSLRAMGVVCVAVAAGLTFAAAGRAFGPAAGWAAGLLFALSPNVAYTGVEIRAYPLFLLTSAGALHAAVPLLERGVRRPRETVALAVWLIAGFFVHFFAVVLAGAILTALAADALSARRRPRLVLVPTAGLAVAAAGLVPFLFGAVEMSDELDNPGNRDRAGELLQLAARTLGHPAQKAVPGAAELSLFAAAVLGLTGLAAAGRRRRVWRLLVLALAAGAAATAAATFAADRFQAARPQYSLWMLPMLFTVLSAGTTVPTARVRRMARAAAAVLLAGQAVGSAVMWTHGDHFVRCPQRRLIAMIDSLGGPDRVAVVLDESDEYRSLFFPLYLHYGRALRVWVPAGTDTPGARSFLERAAAGRPVREVTSEAPVVVVLRKRWVTASELAGRLRGGDPAFPPGRLLRELAVGDPPVPRVITGYMEMRADVVGERTRRPATTIGRSVPPADPGTGLTP